MPKKSRHHDPNLSKITADGIIKSIENNKLLAKILKADKEERFKLIDVMNLDNFSYWMDMKTCLPDDYFICDKKYASNYANNNGSVDGSKMLNGQNSVENSHYKRKMKQEGINGLKAKKKSANITEDSNIKRAFPNTLEELEKEFFELKGKSLTYHVRLRKKGLYSRIIKKKRKEERTKLKQEKTNNLTSEKKGNKIKIKPVKHIFNNEGKVVSSKFDFTETEQTKNTNKTSEIALANNKSTVNKIITNQGKKRLNNKINTNNTSEVIFMDDGSKVNKIIPNHGKKRLNAELNGNFSLESKKFKMDKKVKITNAQESKVESVKQEKKLSFEPVFNRESKMVFSKFEFSEKKNKKNKKEEKDPTKILEKMKEKEANFKELEASGSKDKAMEMKEKEKWAIALKRAKGEKVKDDPELLKKSLREEKHKKLHSKKKWEARILDVQKSKQEKQQKRSDNIGARKTEKKKKKIKRAIKKGRYVPPS